MIFKNANIFFAGYDISGDSNEVALDVAANMLDNTRFKQTTRSFVPGLLDVKASGKGYVRYGANLQDSGMAGKVLAAGQSAFPISIAPNANDGYSGTGGAVVEGDTVYFFDAVSGFYKPISGQVGVNLPFEWNAENAGRYPCILGKIIHDGTNDLGDSPGVGNPFNITGPTATQRAFGALHVITASGASIDIVIQSSNQADFDDVVTNRITFANKTTAGQSEFASAAYDATKLHNYWRISYTVTGTVKIIVAFGVGNVAV